MTKIQKMLLVGSAALGFMYFKQKTKGCTMYLVKGEKVCEGELQGYHMWYSNNKDIKSGYYHWTNFPTGFGDDLDKAWVKKAAEETVELTMGTPIYDLAQSNLERYWDGTEPITFIK